VWAAAPWLRGKRQCQGWAVFCIQNPPGSPKTPTRVLLLEKPMEKRLQGGSGQALTGRGGDTGFKNPHKKKFSHLKMGFFSHSHPCPKMQEASSPAG